MIIEYPLYLFSSKTSAYFFDKDTETVYCHSCKLDRYYKLNLKTDIKFTNITGNRFFISYSIKKFLILDVTDDNVLELINKHIMLQIIGNLEL